MGLFGRKEVDADLIIYGIFCDYALKRRLVTCCVNGESVWCHEYDYIKTRRPPQLKGLEPGPAGGWRAA